ncbi:MAG: SPOR domain-containing protein [Crocinitomicaceae bacterium]
MILEEAIVNLLLRHNCVVVPSFGGFVAQSTSAVIDMRSGIMQPPRKSVLFNRQLMNNDGLLIAHLSKQEGLEYASAEQLLKENVDNWNARLKEGQRVSIDKIGHLYLDAERNISFEQDRFFNLLLQSYGLSKVHFITEEEVKIAEYQHRPDKIAVAPSLVADDKMDFSPREIPVSPVVPEPAAKIIELNEEFTPRKKVWRYVAAAALLPFAFYTYWIPMKTKVLESGMISIRDFNPAYQAGEGVYQQNSFTFQIDKKEQEISFQESIKKLGKEVEVYSYKFDDGLFIPVRLKEEENEKTNVVLVEKPIPLEPKIAAIPAPKEKPIVINTVSSPQYIVGCYSNHENAETMLKEMKAKGLKGQILTTSTGLVRVSAGGSKNPAEMQAIISKTKTEGYSGWILQ